MRTEINTNENRRYLIGQFALFISSGEYRRGFLLFFIFLITSCNIYDVPSTYIFSVLANYPITIKNGGPVINAEILVKNVQTGREFIQLTNENGEAIFNVRGGNYDIILSFTEKHELEIEGFPTLKTLLFSGRLNGQLIVKEGITLSIECEYTFQTEGFVIKELYTSASRNPEGKTYGADKFIEIFNNSENVLFSDGLCIGILPSVKTYEPWSWVNAKGELLPRIPLWGFVAIVPGTGNDYPIQPGDSFVVALSGLNHRDDPNGNPNSIDLSGSAWEFYVEDGRYADAPGVPNIIMQRISKANAMPFAVGGQISVIFRLPNSNLEEIFTNATNYMVEPGGTMRCFMVPHVWVIDGVENPGLDDRGVYKRLPNSIDVGYIQHKGGYEGVSIKRKVKEVINGRTIYQDTNNSTNDFLTDQKPTPGEIATK